MLCFAASLFHITPFPHPRSFSVSICLFLCFSLSLYVSFPLFTFSAEIISTIKTANKRMPLPVPYLFSPYLSLPAAISSNPASPSLPSIYKLFHNPPSIQLFHQPLMFNSLPFMTYSVLLNIYGRVPYLFLNYLSMVLCRLPLSELM